MRIDSHLDGADPTTARAFMTMFRRAGEHFQFPADTSRSDDESEVTGALLNSNDHGQWTVMVKGGYDHDGETPPEESEQFNAVDKISETLEEMGLTLLEEACETEEYDGIGTYSALIRVYGVTTALSGEPWNVPHFVVYGSMTPEHEEVFDAELGHKCEYANIRNHYIIYGEELSESDTVAWSDAIQDSPHFFADEQQNYVSDIRTGHLI